MVNFREWDQNSDFSIFNNISTREYTPTSIRDQHYITQTYLGDENTTKITDQNIKKKTKKIRLKKYPPEKSINLEEIPHELPPVLPSDHAHPKNKKND